VCSPHSGVCPMLTGMLQAGSYKHGARWPSPRCAVLTYVFAPLPQLGGVRYDLFDGGWSAPGVVWRRRAQQPLEAACALPDTIPGRGPHADAFPDDVGEEQLRGSIHGPVPVHFGSRW
jgi:hypothetical protein